MHRLVAHAGRQLDLKGDGLAIATLNDEVHLVLTRPRTEEANPGFGCLGRDPHRQGDERLEQYSGWRLLDHPQLLKSEYVPRYRLDMFYAPDWTLLSWRLEPLRLLLCPTRLRSIVIAEGSEVSPSRLLRSEKFRLSLRA